MRRAAFITVSCLLAAPLGAGPGAGLTVKDLVRVEQVRGDAGGLSKSLARGPANNATPNDFGGVYQVPEDADSPYAGWYARVSGAVIAVFPRGEYVASREGVVPTIPANTKFFMGSIPVNDRAHPRARPEGRAVEAASNRVDRSARTAPPEERPTLAHDAPAPVTVATASSAQAAQSAIDKFCADPVYRTNRVRELIEAAARGK